MADNRPLIEKLRAFAADGAASDNERAVARSKIAALEAADPSLKQRSGYAPGGTHVRQGFSGSWSTGFGQREADIFEEMFRQRSWSPNYGYERYERPDYDPEPDTGPIGAECEYCSEVIGDEHIIWITKEQDALYPCQMSNGHLMASINLLKKKTPSRWVTSRLDALEHERERRDRVGWSATRWSRARA